MSSTTESAPSALSLNNPEKLALNAISTVTISGLPTIPSGACPSLTLSRVSLPVLKYTPFYPDAGEEYGPNIALHRLHDGPPARLPSRLPPPGDASLSLSVDALLWDRAQYYEDDFDDIGTNSRVYSTTIDDKAKPRESFPSLVIKVATGTQIAFLIREACLYEEMESIQGIAVPRCYGIFAGWLPKRCKLEKKRGFGDEYSDSDDDTDDHSESDEDKDKITDNVPGKYGNPSLKEYPSEKAYTRRSTFAPNEVYVLLLEQLSGEVEFPLTLWPTVTKEDLRQDIYDVAEDLASLHIEHWDLDWRNIQVTSPEWSIFCPAHNRRHCVHLFDFSHSHKRDLRPERIFLFATSPIRTDILRRVFGQLSETIPVT